MVPFQRVPFTQLPALPRKPHRFFSLPLQTVTVHSSAFGTIQTAYRSFGDGPPLLLVHGLMTTSYSWRYVYEALGAHFRVVMLDLPGCGRTDKPPHRSYEPQALAQFVHEFMRTVSIEGCAAIGNSLGGYLCMRLAMEAPDAFSRLLNLHSPAIAFPRMYALRSALRLPVLPALTREGMRLFSRRWVWMNVHYRDESLKSIEELDEYGAMLADRDGAKAFFRYLSETVAPEHFADFCAQLERRRSLGTPFPIPLHLLYAREDPMVPPETGAHLRALVPGASFAWIDDSSHFAHVDTPERFVEMALPFLREKSNS